MLCSQARHPDVSIIEKFEAAAESITEGAGIVAAVSGGADSVALLHLLKTLPNRLTIAHFDHGTRAGQSAEDARFVSRLGERLGIEVIVGTGDVEAARREMGTSFQEAARVLRHRFLEDVRIRVAAGWIALGHTADDQVETLLINLLRGSGPRGLAAMAPVSGALVRPLLDCYRVEIEAFLRERQIAYRDDESNVDRRYLRNRVRLELIPALSAINPRVRQTLVRTARVLKDEDDFLEDLARARFGERFGAWRPGDELPLQGFQGQPEALKRRWIRQILHSALGSLRRVSAGHVEAVLELVDRPRVGRQISLPGGMAAVSGYDSLYFVRTSRSRERIQHKVSVEVETLWLAVPGETILPATGHVFRTRLLSREEAADQPAGGNRLLCDFDKTGPRIGVRFPRPGDRFAPLGMVGSKKLKAFFIDAKIPAAERGTVPVLTAEGGGILWVCGLRASENYRVTEAARRVLLVEMEPGESPAGA